MDFTLLGPFEARHDGQRIDVGTRRQERCLLAILLLAAGQIVPVTRIIDLLWEGDPPQTARSAVHTYVGRLRSSLDPYEVRIVTRHDGYMIEADEHTIDVAEFTRLGYRAVGVRDPTERAQLLDRALSLWRGPLLADLADEQLRDRLGGDLVELRLSSSELRAEAKLAMGHHDRVVTDLAPLTAQHPTRERLVAALMTALHRCGRQADALSQYRATRHVLAEELGIEPGAELQTLHQRILRNDHRLERPTTPIYVVKIHGQSLPWAVGGHPALEFCNTFAGWGSPPAPGSEWLRSYGVLAVWAGYMDLADEHAVSHLLQDAQRNPLQAARVLDEARRLRTHLYRCLTDLDDHAAFEVVANYAVVAAKMSVFRRGDDGLGRWSLPLAAGLQLPLHAAALAGAELLADSRRHTIRVCPSERCGWLFLDRTGMRKWCSTKTCGNVDGCAEAR